jgi:hypothetical protein
MTAGHHYFTTQPWNAVMRVYFSPKSLALVVLAAGAVQAQQSPDFSKVELKRRKSPIISTLSKVRGAPSAS